MAFLPALGDRFEVFIEAMDDEGRGRGFIQRDVDVAVRGGFAGELAEVIVEKIFESRKLVIARTTRIVEASPLRVQQICPHKSPCPACPLHGADISLALEIKRGRIERALSDVGLSFEIDDVLTHPHEFGYRQKVKLMVGGQAGDLKVGVYVPYSHQLVSAHACPYVHPNINHALIHLMERLNQLRIEPDSGANTGLKAIILRAGQKGVAVILIMTRPFSTDEWSELISLVEEKHLLALIEKFNQNTNSIVGGTFVQAYGSQLIQPLEGDIPIDPDSFCQSDPVQAKTMYELVAQYLTQDSCEGYFIDAYAGVGGFSEALLSYGASQIVAIESSLSSMSSLRSLGIQVQIQAMKDALSNLSQLRPISGVVVDPPKKGLMEDAHGIARLAAPRVALVSCDPDAMAKDLQVFLQYDYLVEKILPIDLFGGTPAIETLVLLHKR